MFSGLEVSQLLIKVKAGANYMHEMSLQRSSGHALTTPLRHILEEHKDFTMSKSKAVGFIDLV